MIFIERNLDTLWQILHQIFELGIVKFRTLAIWLVNNREYSPIWDGTNIQERFVRYATCNKILACPRK